MQHPWTEETPSLLIGLPAVTFGQGHGAYWRLSRLMAQLKRAVASESCDCATEEVSRYDALTLICENVQADLQKFALDFPQTNVAELVRRGHYLEALAGYLQPDGAKASPSSGIDRTAPEPPPIPIPSLRLSVASSVTEPGEVWNEVILAQAVGILADSAIHLEGSHRYSLTIALVVLLLVCKRAGLSYLHPRANNISANFVQVLVSRHLIKRPEWMRGGQVPSRELYKSWADVFKAHMARVQRAKYRLDQKARFSAVYGLNDTGEAYFVQRMLNEGIQLTAIEMRTAQAQAKIGLAAGYPLALRQPTSAVGPDQHLEDLKAV